MSFFGGLRYKNRMRYNWHVVLPRQEGGDILVELFNFILSVVASVVGNYISKWLDGEDE